MVVCAVQEAGIDGAFCAGWIELAVLDKDGHFSSGFEEGLRLLNMSFCDDVDGVGSSIVAWRNLRGINVNVYVMDRMNKRVSEVKNECSISFLKNECDNYNKPELRNTSKIAGGISGSKLKFKGEFDAKVTLDGKTHKTKIYVIAGENANLFGIVLIDLFDLWEKPINAFCCRLNASSMGKSKQTENFVNKLKSEFDKIFADELVVVRRLK